MSTVGRPTFGEAVYRAVFDHSLDGVLLTVPDGRILAANPAACAILGATEEEICRRGRQGFSDPDDPQWAQAIDDRRRAGSVRAVVPMLRADGTTFVADLSSAIFLAEDGNELSCVILRDVTDRVRTEQCLSATNDITHALLAGDDTTEVLATVAERAMALLGTTDAAVVTAGERVGSVVVAAAAGERFPELVGRAYPPGTLAAQVMATRQSLLVGNLATEAAFEDGRRLGLGPAMVVPIVSGARAFGNIIVGTSRPDSPPFDQSQLSVVEMFAEAAGVALALGEVRADLERMAVATEQTRIAADLHDHVIQELYAAGLRLHALISTAPSPVVKGIREAVQTIDATITDIRHTIYGLQHPTGQTDIGNDVEAIAREAGALLGFPPTVSVGAPCDIESEPATQLLRVLREALSNVVRHAHATQVEVRVSADDDRVTLAVTDDGIGPPSSTTSGLGLRNMRRRAATLGGTFSLEAASPRGSRLVWSVPRHAHAGRQDRRVRSP